MRAYKNIALAEGQAKRQGGVIVKRKNLHIFSMLLIFLVTLSCFGLSLSSLKIAREVRHITSYWAPNLTGLGKLKFVGSDELTSEAAALVEDFALPFKNSLVTGQSDGSFVVNGLGGVIVKACLDGKVTKIEREGTNKTVTLSHAYNLKTVYEGITTLGVKEGDGVSKNTPLGTSESSQITFKILYKNKLMGGIIFDGNEFSFV